MLHDLTEGQDVIKPVEKPIKISGSPAHAIWKFS